MTPAAASRRTVRLARALAGCLAISLSAPADAADIWVDCVNGDDTSGNGSPTSPYRGIQKGVDSGVAGDTVRVKAGICTISVDPVLMRPGVSVIGAGRTATFIRTTAYSAFHFQGDGLTFPPSQVISDMDIAADNVTGVTIWGGSPTIRNNVIHGGGSGGGVRINTLYPDANPDNRAGSLIEGNVFREVNSSVEVASIDARASIVVRRNWMLGSIQPGVGQIGVSGEEVSSSLTLALENNVVAHSRLGFNLFGSSPSINNNTITATENAIVLDSSGYPVVVTSLNNNLIAYNGGGIVEYGSVDSTITEMRNNDFYLNSAGDYFDVILGPVSDVNRVPNASANVKLLPSFTDPARDDYHISPASAVRDAGTIGGTPADDIDGQARNDGAPDIGADETSNAGLPSLRVTNHVHVADLCPGTNPPGGNGTVDPGEVVDVRWEVTNFSALAQATNVRITITPNTGGVYPPSATVDVGRVLPLRSALSGVYSFRWDDLDCRSKIRFNLQIFSTETGLLASQDYEIRRASCDPCSNPQRPSVQLQRTDLADECPNGIPPGANGRIDPGETGKLTFNLVNTSAAARATNVTMTVSTSTPGVTPTMATLAVGSLDPLATGRNAVPFTFQVNPALVSCGATIRFDLAISWLELLPASPNTTFEVLTVPSPCVDCSQVMPDLLFAARTFTTACTGGGTVPGQIRPGERVDLTLSVRNASTSAGATTVRGTLHALSPYVTPQTLTIGFGTILPGATRAAAPVQLRVAGNAPCGTQLDFDLELESDQTGTLARQRITPLTVAPACVTCADTPPAFDLSGPSVVDICLGASPPGGDGTINPGETVELTINVVNTSNSATATSVTADLFVQEAWVSPPSGAVFIGSIPPQAVRPSTFPYSFEVARSATLCGDVINVDVVLDSTETGPVPPRRLQLLVDPTCATGPDGQPGCPRPRPDLAIVGQTIDDRCPYGGAGGDGRVDPGEFVDLAIEVANASTFAPASGVTAVISTTAPGIAPPSGAVAGPDVQPATSGQLDPFTFTVDRDVVSCGATIRFEVRLSSIESGPLPPIAVNVVVNGCASCREELIGVLLYRETVPALAAGWKATYLPVAPGGTIDTGWPQTVNSPGTTLDAGIVPAGGPAVLYRLLDPSGGDLGNLLRLAKVPMTNDLRVAY